ncbi:ammonium transporter protein [Clostridium sp. CAG:967]|nr:ammonium transporter protein [Clostridium sp. CAG:967]
MNSYDFEQLNEFFTIKPEGNEIFRVLKKLIDFDSAYIFFVNPLHLEYSYNPREIDIENIKEPYLKENLSVKNTVFGILIITGKEFSEHDQRIFKICASIISNITKDIEISKIIKMQVEALREGYEKVQESNRKILEAEKVKSNFLSHISHELRTPLNSILGFSDMLEKEFVGKLNEKQKEYINDIQTAGLHLLGMINEILDMSKIEANAVKLNLRTFDINQVVLETINIIQPLAAKKKLNLTTDIKDFEIKADYQKIQQILFNLLSNAIKFTPQNGKITVKARKDNKNITISVQDNGIGIDKKYHKKIFEKFEQFAQQNESSTGLGLAITKELVKLHNGKIKVKSEPSSGSTFTISLPVVI